MEKQKICIIGGNLTGLVTAIAISRLNCQIDLITGNVIQNHKSNRTIAISETYNLNFLNKLNINKLLKKILNIRNVALFYNETIYRNQK